MREGELLKYMRINEPVGGAILVPVAMAAGQVIKAKSGRFVYMNAGAATLNADGVGSIYGFLTCHEHTPNVGDKFGCDTDLNGIFRIPINSGTYAAGMIGDTCDISISSNIQGAQLDASVENTLTIVGGDELNNLWVDVKMTPAEWGTGIGVDA